MKRNKTLSNYSLVSLMVEVSAITDTIKEMRSKKEKGQSSSPCSVTAMPNSPETRMPSLKFSAYQPAAVISPSNKQRSGRFDNPCASPVKTKQSLFINTICNRKVLQQSKKNHCAYSSIGPAHL